MEKRINKSFFSRDARKIAKKLLGKVLVRKLNGKKLKSRIVETEAYYGSDDPASRAKQNGNLRKVMLGIPGTILVYGVHNNWLINFVTGKKDKAEAVLLRALEPINFKERLSGPGLLTKGLKIDKGFHEKFIDKNEGLWLEDRENSSFEICESKRIGIKKDLPQNMRFYIKGNNFVSR